ncbi:MAG: hypothetical protein HY902_09110 [Deltaproteobacteria bacterium]|nr:hypothetical protein [Deltaproteobacteria bacterium]
MLCDPGKDGCNGKVAAKCKADGSGFESGGTDCGANGKVCSAGVCVSLKCDPQNPLYCEGNIAMKCDGTGMNPATLQTCGAGQFCDKGVCQAQACTPNTLGCNGNLVATCSAQGSGWLAGGINCAATGGSCSAGKCVTGYASCAAILATNKAAADGVYPIDPDGAGPIAAVNLFCDMKNGGLTLVANIYDSAGDDAPNSTDYVVSGWQQTASGAWNKAASKVDRDATGAGSAAVSLEFVKALGVSAGLKHLKMCFVHQNGTDTTCRDSADASLTLVSYATGNPKLTVFASDKLTYTFGRLAGLAGSVDGYGPVAENSFCVPAAESTTVGQFGKKKACAPGKNFGLCDHGEAAKQYIWHGYCGGAAYAPAAPAELDSSDPVNRGFRLYIGPQATCGNGVKEAPEACDDGNLSDGDGCSAKCTVDLACAKPSSTLYCGNELSTLATSTMALSGVSFPGDPAAPHCTGCEDTWSPTSAKAVVPPLVAGTSTLAPSCSSAIDQNLGTSHSAVSVPIKAPPCGQAWTLDFHARTPQLGQRGSVFVVKLSGGVNIVVSRWHWNGASESAVDVQVYNNGPTKWLIPEPRIWGWTLGSSASEYYKISIAVDSVAGTLGVTFVRPEVGKSWTYTWNLAALKGTTPQAVELRAWGYNSAPVSSHVLAIQASAPMF